jgi:hypothetical protein
MVLGMRSRTQEVFGRQVDAKKKETEYDGRIEKPYMVEEHM